MSSGAMLCVLAICIGKQCGDARKVKTSLLRHGNPDRNVSSSRFYLGGNGESNQRFCRSHLLWPSESWTLGCYKPCCNSALLKVANTWSHGHINSSTAITYLYIYLTEDCQPVFDWGHDHLLLSQTFEPYYISLYLVLFKNTKGNEKELVTF